MGYVCQISRLAEQATPDSKACKLQEEEDEAIDNARRGDVLAPLKVVWPPFAWQSPADAYLRV